MYCRLLYHILLPIRHGENLIPPAVSAKVYAIIAEVVGTEGGHLQAIGGEADHLHLLVELPPAANLHSFVKGLKEQTQQQISRARWMQWDFRWSEEELVFSINSREAEAQADHISQQKLHHQYMSLREEWEYLLESQDMKRFTKT